MKLHQPVKNFKPELYPNGDITQWFGENKELYSKSVCNEFGCLQGHNGIDIVRPWGEAIFCVCSGKVVEVKESPDGYGKHIRILGSGYEWTYGHLSNIWVSLGDEVKSGDIIGGMGNTGFVVSGATPYWKYNPFAGTHLHLQKREFTPNTFGLKWNISYPTGDKGTIENYDNGFFGSLPITAEDFDSGERPDVNLTIESLNNYALEAEYKGDTVRARIYRAVVKLIQSFISH